MSWKKRLHRGSVVYAWANSKDSFTRPCRFRLLECEKKIVLVVYQRLFQKIQIRTSNRDSKQVKTFSEMINTGCLKQRLLRKFQSSMFNRTGHLIKTLEYGVAFHGCIAVIALADELKVQVMQTAKCKHFVKRSTHYYFNG